MSPRAPWIEWLAGKKTISDKVRGQESQISGAPLPPGCYKNFIFYSEEGEELNVTHALNVDEVILLRTDTERDQIRAVSSEVPAISLVAVWMVVLARTQHSPFLSVHTPEHSSSTTGRLLPSRHQLLRVALSPAQAFSKTSIWG